MPAGFAQQLTRKNAVWLGLAALGLLLALVLGYRFVAAPTQAPGSQQGGRTASQLPGAEQIGRFAARVPGADQLDRLANLLDRRSPGERTAGELVKAKIKGAPQQRALGKIPPRAPEQRALGKIVTPPLVAPELPLVTPAPGLTAPLDTLGPVAPGGLTGPLAALPPFGQPTFPLAPGGAVVLPPAVGPDVVTPPAPPPPVAAIPEPATWATMLAGFAFIGLALRRRPALRRRLRVLGPEPARWSPL